MLDPASLLTELAHCIGTENYYAHWTKQLVYTDGVKHLAEGAECFWLIDAIASHQPHLNHTYPELCDRQTWTLTVNPARMASLVCAIAGHEQAIRQEILFTDFPLPEFKLYCFDSVLLLPSEN